MLDPTLPATAKLTGMLLYHPGGGNRTPRTLQALSGLSRHTVRRALALLSTSDPPTGPTVGVPTDLLTDPRLTAREKLLYARLLLAHPLGPTSYRSLATLVGMSINPVKLAVRRLVEADWLRVAQRNRHGPLDLLLRDPHAERRSQATAAARRRLERAAYRGEALGVHAIFTP